MSAKGHSHFTFLFIGSYMYVDVSQYDVGEKARFQLPVMKENDTHCIDFNYLLTSPDGSSPGTLNILVKVSRIWWENHTKSFPANYHGILWTSAFGEQKNKNERKLYWVKWLEFCELTPQ